jgi:glycosyltransferase involved in cell wall biosynthesis
MIPSRPIRSNRYSEVTPHLSVLIPFYKETPLKLLQALRTRMPEYIEIIILDDGSNEAEITSDVADFIAQSPLAVVLITLTENEGRARGRNRLTSAARAPYYLFLDADMYPGDSQFLDTWLAHIDSAHPAVTFGGFGVTQPDKSSEHAVHHALATHSDCLKAVVRSETPEKYVFTSNLLVHRDVFETEGFDPQFTGWGWEDVEWAMRVSKRFRITHIDNEALHLGLDTVESLLRKYEQSVPNFARVIGKHPEIVRSYPSYKIAKTLSRLPLLGLIKQGLRAFVRQDFVPAGLRAFGLRLYRVSLYAEVTR